MPKREEKEIILPGYPDVELALLGAALLWNDSGPAIVCNALSADDFIDGKCECVFRAMKNLVERRETVDATTLIAELTNRKWDKFVGGAKFIYEMIETVVSDESKAIDHYCKLIKSASLARKLILCCKDVCLNFNRDMAAGGGMDWDGYCESVRAKVNEICDGNSSASFMSASEAVRIALDEVKAAKESSSASGLIGVETGLLGLNKLTHGWQPGQLIVLAGKSSMGKSAFAIHSAYSAAKAGYEVAYFSLEMSNSSNLKRILSNETKVLTDKMIAGYASKEEMAKLEEAAAAIGQAPMHFTDRISSFDDISAEITRLKARRQGLKAVFIDYLQLMSCSQKGLSRDREIGIQTGGLKRLASKLGLAIVLLSQVNRGTSSDRPTMDNLRESGNIEQDANVVIFVHRLDYFDRTKPQPRISETEIIIAKNREGQTGTVKAVFDKGISRFSDLAEQHGASK